MPENGNVEAGSEQRFFRIGQVCRLTDIKSFTLRYWESEFPTLQPVKSAKGQRLYRREDVETVLRIKRLLYDEGFTIAGARRYLRDLGQGPGHAEAAPAVRPSAAESAAVREAQPEGRGAAPAALEDEDDLMAQYIGASLPRDIHPPRASAPPQSVAADTAPSKAADAASSKAGDTTPNQAATAAPNVASHEARHFASNEARHHQDAQAAAHQDSPASPRSQPDAADRLSRKLLLDLRDSLRAFLTLLENE